MKRQTLQLISFILAIIGTIIFFKNQYVGMAIALIALVLATGSFLIKGDE